MSSAGHSARAGAGAGAGAVRGEGAGLQALSFKLRFAAQREPGRSYVSLVKPRELPATVTGKFYSREDTGAAADATSSAERRALRRIEEMFEAGPRSRLPAPRAESHEYGWWVAEAGRAEPRLRHHIRDSAWLKARLLVLAADDKLKRK